MKRLTRNLLPLLCAASLSSALAAQTTTTTSPVASGRSLNGVSNLPRQSGDPKLVDSPLTFERNLGQFANGIEFVVHGRGGVIVLTHGKAGFATDLENSRVEAQSGGILWLKPVGANGNARAEAEGPLPGRANYFLGNESKSWRHDVPMFSRVRYHQIYPGIDLVYYGNQHEMEYDFLVQPGADPAQIGIEFEGAETVELTPEGDLLLGGSPVRSRVHKPIVYQVTSTGRTDIAGAYVLGPSNRATFRLGPYDHTQPLIIDPVLSFSAAFGGSGLSQGNALATDGEGNTYVAGVTASLDFPLVNPYQTNYHGAKDAFVAKFDSTGALLFSTYLGGKSADSAQGIALDTNGNVYVAGYTLSPDFPNINALQSTNAGGYDAFVTELSPGGNGLIYSTYLGGSGLDAANAIAVDSAGDAIITGHVESTNFPVANAFQPVLSGNQDAFVAKLAQSGKSLVYSTYLGGTGGENMSSSINDLGGAVALDLAGNAYVTGWTYSTNFPILNAFQPTKGDPYSFETDAFITKFDPQGGLVYSTYLGGGSSDFGRAIAVDSAGNVYVGGSSSSYIAGLTSYNFPLFHGLQPYGGAGESNIGDGFLTALDVTGTNLLFSTFLGGNGDDQVNGVAVDKQGSVAVTGFTDSADFPRVNTLEAGGNQGFFVSSNGAWRASNSGIADAVVKTMQADPVDPATFYLGTRSSVLKSTDSGTHWSMITNGISYPGANCLAIAASQAGTLYLGNFAGVFKTTDAGTNWKSFSSGFPGSFPSIQAVAVDPVDASAVYAAPYLYGIYKTVDGGTNWLPVNNGLLNTNILSIFVDPQNPLNVYASANAQLSHSLFKSIDGGTNWNLLTNTFPNGAVSAMVFNPTNSQNLYAAVGGSSGTILEVSTNGGNSWSGLLFSFGFTFTSLALDPSVPSTIYLGTDQGGGYGVLRSVDAGNSWAPYGLAGDLVKALAVNPTNSSSLFAAVDGGRDAFFMTVTGRVAVAFSTYLGGTGADSGNGVAFGTPGKVQVTGFTSAADFPTNSVPRPALLTEHKIRSPRAGTIPTANKGDGFVAEYDISDLVASPCPGGEADMLTATFTLAHLAPGETTATLNVGDTFSGTFFVYLYGDGSSNIPDSVSVEGDFPPGITTGTVTFDGKLTTPGTYTFTVIAYFDGCPYVNKYTLIVNPTTAITSVSPTNGVQGTSLVISGFGFTNTTAVTFGGGAPAQFIVSNDTQIIVVVPTNASSGFIKITTTAGTTPIDSLFMVLPTISDVSPHVGAPGTTVTITGTALTGATFVSFGGIVTSNLTVNSDNELTVQVPSNAVGGLLSVGTAAGVALDGLFTVIGFNNLYFGTPFVVASATNPQVTIDLHIDRTNGQPTQVTTARYAVEHVWERRYMVGLRRAEPAEEFIETMGSVTFAPTDTVKQITINILTNSPWLSPSLFSVWLTTPSPDAELAEPRQIAFVRDYSDILANRFKVQFLPSSYKLSSNLKFLLDWSPRGHLEYVTSLTDVWQPVFSGMRPPATIILGNSAPPISFYRWGPNSLGYPARFMVISRDGSPKTDVLFSSPRSGTFGMTDALGTVVLDGLPPGTNPVAIQTITSVITNITAGGGVVYHFGINFNVTIVSGPVQVPLKVDICGLSGPPMGASLPWSAIAGGTINNVQTVVATGGKLGYSGGEPFVTVIGPGGPLGTTSEENQTFSPAANGHWRVITVQSNMTREAHLIFP